MTRRKKKKLVHEGQYVAEVEVELLMEDDDWSPYLSLDDAYRLDDVREALKNNDTDTASKYGTVYELRKVR